MRAASASLALLAFLAGCAHLMESDCRVDWYKMGLRDGMGNWPMDVDLYARECARYGIVPDAGRYMKGWHDGFGETHQPEDRG